MKLLHVPMYVCMLSLTHMIRFDPCHSTLLDMILARRHAANTPADIFLLLLGRNILGPVDAKLLDSLQNRVVQVRSDGDGHTASGELSIQNELRRRRSRVANCGSHSGFALTARCAESQQTGGVCFHGAIGHLTHHRVVHSHL